MRLHVAAPVDAESVGHPGTQPAPKCTARGSRLGSLKRSVQGEAWVCGANAGFQRNGAH